MSDKVGEQIVDVETEDGRNESESDSTRLRKRPRAQPNSPLIVIESRGVKKGRDSRPEFGFQLMDIEGLPSINTFKLDEHILPNAQLAVLCDYQFDLEWLFGEHPILLGARRLVIVHGDSDSTAASNQTIIDNLGLESRIKMHKPFLPIPYGTHHTKLILFFYEQGLRVIVHTANMVASDWKTKTQGMYVRDFPLISSESSIDSEFSLYLLRYLQKLGTPLDEARKLLPRYDCSNAGVSLVASVPGRHTGLDLDRFGHMRVRNLLSKEQMDVEAENAPLVCQYSSLGSLQESWLLHEFKTSLSSRKGGGIRANRAPIQLVWPTVEQVRTSLAGYSSGGSLPCPQRNLKPFLSPLFHRWDGSASNRTEAMPHIKTYLRHSDGKLHFFMLTSANLSGAAWGKLEKGGSQLFVRSYELGVLFLPSFYTESSFSLSASRPCRGLSDGKYEFSVAFGEHAERAKLTSTERTIVLFPVAHKLPPLKYTPSDRPWYWDGVFSKQDRFGMKWPMY
ncbi:hypothetical protein NDN08_007364 [Rhodosorus marinus]|uniref:Tyrosyl-DNA phosphodiesterase 1 n=1 Tax=Rhodosorus marinus TaxID=101924 RepID=A0AAV8UG98_9RHOD|nr:hypothetical protein NDN08_007364 [Rhodosorus marinus]